MKEYLKLYVNEIINLFGGQEDVCMLLTILGVFFILNSSIKNNRLRFFVSLLTSLVSIAQGFSLYLTQSFIGYQFYVHANLRGIVGMEDLFLMQVSIAVLIFLVLLITNYYSHKVLTLLYSKINNPKIKGSIRAVMGICLVFLGYQISQGNIVNDTKSLLPLVSSSNTNGFKSVLQKYNMADYVTPDDIISSAGQNIIVISMESLEKAFLHEKYADLTPNLNQLKKQWNYFDLKQNSGSAWTSGSLYTYLTGFPAFFGIHGNNIFQTAYHSNISSISNALNEANYSTTYLNGNTDFSGIKEMLNVLGFDKIIDYKSAAKTGNESEYGLRDKELFSLAKQEITLQQTSNKPFSLFISTTDTHFPDGIYDARMESIIPPKASNFEFTVACLDYFIGDFISFLDQKGLMENTTIYIFPDHLKMGDPSMFDGTGERGLYVITNSKSIDSSRKDINQIDLPNLILEGANVSHNLKFLTDFIPGNKEDFIQKNMLGLTEINRNGILNPTFGTFDVNKVSANYESYKNDKSRFIAHAGGEINGDTYTNSLEALNLSYEKGFRLFELDIIQTSEGKFVAAHDWENWSKITEYKGETPVSTEQFLSEKLFGKYTPLDMDAINAWFTEHKDAILVTDKVNDPIKFSAAFIDKNRLMMELFDEQSVEEGLQSGILSAMPSESIIDTLSIENVEMMAEKGVKHIAISRRFIAKNKAILMEFKKYEIKPYVFHVNYDIGIDEEYVTKYEMDYIYGMYADKWNFD